MWQVKQGTSADAVDVGEALDSVRDEEEACDGTENVADVENAADAREALGNEQEHQSRDANGKAEQQHDSALGSGVLCARTVEDVQLVEVHGHDERHKRARARHSLHN